MSTSGAPVVLDETALNIFTDGSSLSGPRRGGIGYRFVIVDGEGNEVSYDSRAFGFHDGTNQQMELMACVEALRELVSRYSPVDPSPYKKVVIYTDSLYVAENLYQAKFVWPRTKWQTSDGNPVINAQLWKDLIRAIGKVGKKVEIVWRKGHTGSNPHNQAVDRLAKDSARGALRAPVRPVRVRRKRTDRSTEVGSIPAEGQVLTMRIVTDEWLRPQRTYRYRCEVTSQDSPYSGNVDFFFSDILLKAGHEYSLLLNDDPARPRIVENHGEIEKDDD
jgi:ribonuclease HI